MTNPINARCLLAVVAMCAGAWFAPPAIASEIRNGVRLPAHTPVQPMAADQTLGLAIMMASVEPNGAITNAIGVTSAVKTSGAGAYELTFERSVRSCGYSAGPNVGIAGAIIITGWFVTAAPHFTDEKILQIRTFHHDGTPGDRFFQVQVICLK